MANWLERAKREIPIGAGAPTAKTDEGSQTAVMAVRWQGRSEYAKTSIGSNGSSSTTDWNAGNPIGDEVVHLGHADAELIRYWLGFIGESDPAIIENLLNTCRIDAAARSYFLSHAKEVSKPDLLEDDRRRCNQCANLKGRVCSIAYPGGLVSANRCYQPIPDLLHRCAGFVPDPDDHDYPMPSNDGVYINL